MTAIIENNLSRNLTGENSLLRSQVFKMLPEALANVPFHKNTDALTRYVAAGFPVHLAVHEVSSLLIPPAEYTQPQVHPEHDEINIILSDRRLSYRVQVGKEIFIVENNCSIWIPRGTMHSANVLTGSGFFITLRI